MSGDCARTYIIELACSQCQAARFRPYAELTLLKVLDAYKDESRDVQRAADECCLTLATHLPPHMSLHTLNPIVKAGEPPMLLPAVKMTTKVRAFAHTHARTHMCFAQVIEQLNETEVLAIVPDIVDGLLRCFEHSESTVRKAAVFCLVAINNAAGDQALTPYTQHLNNSKVCTRHARVLFAAKTINTVHQTCDHVEQQRDVADLKLACSSFGRRAARS